MQQARSPYSGKYLFLLLITVLLSSFAYCDNIEDPIRNGGGARPLGLGRAVTASVDDINAAFFNPAGLAGIKSAQFMGTYYTKVYGNFHYFVSGGAAPTQYGVFGAGFVSSGSDQFPNINSFGTTEGYSEYSDNLTFLTYSDSFKRITPALRNLYYGVNLKFFSKATSGGLNVNANGTNLDLGLKYLPFKWLSIGFTRQNIMGGEMTWNTGRRETYPMPTFIGVAYKDMENRQTYSFDAEFPGSQTAPSLFHMGIERFMEGNFTLRAGLDQIHDATYDKTMWNPSLGLGIEINGLVIDYAFHPYYEDPGYASHFVSISFVNGYSGGIVAVAGSAGKKSFISNEQVPITVTVPFDADSAYAESPDMKRIDLQYDSERNVWTGQWAVPDGFRSEMYNFDVYVFDIEGKQTKSTSDNFFIKEGKAVEVVTPIVVTQEVTAEAKVSSEDAFSILGRYLHRTVDPNELVHRNDMAVIIANIKKYDVVTGEGMIFIDVDPASFEAPYIKACYDRKVLKGYSAEIFGPEKQITLDELIAMISDSEPEKAKRVEIWSYLKGRDRKELVTYRRLVDVSVETRYLKRSDLLIQ